MLLWARQSAFLPPYLAMQDLALSLANPQVLVRLADPWLVDLYVEQPQTKSRLARLLIESGMPDHLAGMALPASRLAVELKTEAQPLHLLR